MFVLFWGCYVENFDEVLMYDMCGWFRVGLFLWEIENCIVVVGEWVVYYVKSGFGRDNKEILG